MDDGYIKFKYNWIKKELDCDISKINKVRDKLYNLRLIGSINGIGYGNISIRFKDGFLITGSGTGKVKTLTKQHYTLVSDYNFENNSITCQGPIVSSSESLTHAAVYDKIKEINAVIHIHSKELWNKLIKKVPTTKKDIAYGSPEMAYEIMNLVNDTNIIVMSGHEDGIVVFGKDLDEANRVLFDYYNKL